MDEAHAEHLQEIAEELRAILEGLQQDHRHSRASAEDKLGALADKLEAQVAKAQPRQKSWVSKPPQREG